MDKPKLLPKGMLQRWLTMILWVISAGLTTLSSPEFQTTTILFALVGVAIVLGIYVMWGPRTRPTKNAFWFLVHIILLAAFIAFAAARPLLGAVAAIPVALLWIHDSPASPTAMLVWGVLLVLYQPDYWPSAGPEDAWNVILAVIVIIAAAQFERNRLAARQFTQSGLVFSFVRLALVFGFSVLFVAAREGLRVVNAFTYIGIDASGASGKITMLGFIFVSIATALMLFRVRPEKPPKLAVTSASERKKIDFDAKPDAKKAAREVDRLTKPGGREERAQVQAKAAKKEKKAAQPGELDFD